MLTKEQKLEMYYYLRLTRTFEDWIFYICHNQNQKSPLIIGKGYLSTGQEAISVGGAYALQKDDWLAPSHRDVGAHFVRGMTLKDMLLQYMGRQGSPTGRTLLMSPLMVAAAAVTGSVADAREVFAVN